MKQKTLFKEKIKTATMFMVLITNKMEGEWQTHTKKLEKSPKNIHRLIWKWSKCLVNI